MKEQQLEDHPQREEQQTSNGLLTVTEAAQRSGLPRTIISSWITTGQLPAVRVNGRRLVRAEDVAAT